MTDCADETSLLYFCLASQRAGVDVVANEKILDSWQMNCQLHIFIQVCFNEGSLQQFLFR